MENLTLLYIGAAIALASSVLSSAITAIISHKLSLRRDKVIRERDKQDREAEEEKIRKRTQLEARYMALLQANPDEMKKIKEKVIEEDRKKKKMGNQLQERQE